ncbi:MAG: Xaa-Pro peptidase family protein [Pseudomonadota bacterium]
MPLHFTVEELAARRARTCQTMTEQGFDGLLLFRQESLYYLTGYDTFGYVYFQCLVLTADGGMTLLTRAPDLRQARYTSVIEDVRVWVDGLGANPVDDLRAILAEKGLRNAKLGVEWDAYGLTAALGFRVLEGLADLVTTEDASTLVSRQRLVKSKAELAYVERAAGLVDEAYDKALNATHAWAFEGDILAELQGAIWRGGGDDPANEQIIGSGPGALMCRYFTGRRHLDQDDQMTLELAGTYRHYHACIMRTVRVGVPPPPRQVAMHTAAVDALNAAISALRPGQPIGAAFDAHAETLDRAGFGDHRMNACGYSLGTTFAPNWMDWPMLYHGNPMPAAPGMVFFVHIILFDSEAGLAATSGHTVKITETGNETLTKSPVEMVVK